MKDFDSWCRSLEDSIEDASSIEKPIDEADKIILSDLCPTTKKEESLNGEAYKVLSDADWREYYLKVFRRIYGGG